MQTTVSSKDKEGTNICIVSRSECSYRFQLKFLLDRVMVDSRVRPRGNVRLCE